MNSIIIVSNLNVFGRTIETILEIVKFLLANKIRIIIVEQSLDLIDDKDMLYSNDIKCYFYDCWIRKRVNEFKNKKKH